MIKREKDETVTTRTSFREKVVDNFKRKKKPKAKKRGRTSMIKIEREGLWRIGRKISQKYS